MGTLFKILAIGSILAFFVCAGWVIMSTSDGVAFRYFLLSALIFVFSVFGGFSWLVWREMGKRKAELQAAQDRLKATIEKHTKNAINN